jgi:hypothetical protein
MPQLLIWHSFAVMALLFGYIENIPEIYAAKTFYESKVGAGQHRSTRYQDFSGSAIVDLAEYVDVPQINPDRYTTINTTYRALQQFALGNYSKYKAVLTESYKDFYNVDLNNGKQKGALDARVFDSARYHLLNGVSTKTSMAYITSAREWARIISLYKASPDRNLNYLGQQLEILYAPEVDFSNRIGYIPEASDLIRYTSADETTSSNLRNLQSHLETKYDFSKTVVRDEPKDTFMPVDVELLDESIDAGRKTLIHYIQSIYPTAEPKALSSWLESLSDDKVNEISEITFRGFTHHKQMGVQARVNALSFYMDLSIAEMRDLNRQRAFGIFVPYMSAEFNYPDLAKTGFTLPAYLTDVPAFENDRSAFEKDLLEYYSRLESFLGNALNEEWFPQYLVPQLLPFGHRVPTYMHGSVKETSYTSQLRARPGGHINYRIAAWLMADQVSKKNRYLRPLSLGEDKKPDAGSREQFLDRS